jgi:hypothetical protein
MNEKILTICSVMGLLFTGCGKSEGGVDTGAMTASTSNSESNSNGTTGDGDGDPGDGDGEADTGDTTGDTMATTAAFVPPIGGDAMGVSDCDPWEKDCPMGEKCVPYGSTGAEWDANKCVPVTGSGSPGDTCILTSVIEGTDDCDADTHCWDVMDVDGVNQGVCTPFCEGSPDDPICADAGKSCLIANDGSINLCIATCDPLIPDCGPGLACFWANNNFNCIFTTADIPGGEPCAYINDCAEGHICLDAVTLPDCGGSACCGIYCSLSDDPLAACESVPGTECVSFFDEGMAPPEYEDVGVCILPA